MSLPPLRPLFEAVLFSMSAQVWNESPGVTTLLRWMPWKTLEIEALLPGFAMVLPEIVALKLPLVATPVPAWRLMP